MDAREKKPLACPRRARVTIGPGHEDPLDHRWLIADLSDCLYKQLRMIAMDQSTTRTPPPAVALH